MTTALESHTRHDMPSTRGMNFFDVDRNLEFVCSTVMDPETLERARTHLVAMGELAGGELDALASLADRNPPTLRNYDATGERIDAVDHHPAFVEMERHAFSRFGLAAMSHRPGVLGWPTAVPHVVKYALSYLFAQSEFGLLCPVSMSDSAARMLRYYGSDDLKSRYPARLITTDFDSLWQATQWMTEKTGGSDVGSSTTLARCDEHGVWRLWGDKWFCSNAKADMALTLARPEGAPAGTRGLAMFLVPRVLPDGTRNSLHLLRLKDKLGSRSMASAEVRYEGAVAYLVGDANRGFRQMMEMVNVSRLSNAMRAAGIMRRCLLESTVHARARNAFGQPLSALPLLRANLLEMLVDVEAAASVVLNAAAVIDQWDAGTSSARRLFRVLTPLAKYWITLRARAVTGEAMTIRGGNGYIEEWVNPRLLRDSHLGSIWEGASNIVALDVQRALTRDDGEAAIAELLATKLGSITDTDIQPLANEVVARWDELRGAIAALPAANPADRELQARTQAEAAYHVVAAGLLVAEAQTLLHRAGDQRKRIVARCYIQRWLRAGRFGTATFAMSDLEHLDSLLDGAPVPA